MDINTLKENFSDGKKPTGEQFGELIDEAVAFSHDSLDGVATQKQALEALVDKVYYVAPKITSFTPADATYDIGRSIDVTFAWTLNKAMTSVTFAGENLDVATTSKSVTGITETTSYTLTVSDGQNTASATRKFTFCERIYWGSATASLTEVSALSNSKLATSKSGSYSVTVESGQYGYLAIPTNLGSIETVNIGGFDTEMVHEGVVTNTNSYGHETTYNIYRTGQMGLGSITMKI